MTLVAEEAAPDRFTTEPIRAWKRAHLVSRSGDVGFAGVGMRRSRYGVDGEAGCMAPDGVSGFRMAGWAVVGQDGEWTETVAVLVPHARLPDPECGCGFYAVADRCRLWELLATAGVAELEVELYGTVDVYERGYRASHQRVLAVRLDPHCIVCRREAAGVVLAPGWDPSLAFDERYVVPICATHAGSLPVMTLATLAGLLGAEVMWGDPIELTRGFFQELAVAVGAAFDAVRTAFEEAAAAVESLGKALGTAAVAVGTPPVTALERCRARVEARRRARLELLGMERRRRDRWPWSPAWWLLRCPLRHCGFMARPPDHP